MHSRHSYRKAVDWMDDSMKIELIGIRDESENAAACSERVELLVAQIILLGQTKGRPRREIDDEEKIAA